MPYPLNRPTNDHWYCCAVALSGLACTIVDSIYRRAQTNSINIDDVVDCHDVGLGCGGADRYFTALSMSCTN